MALFVSPPAPAIMLFLMAIITEQLKVVPVQRNPRIPDVFRCQPDLMMNLCPWNNSAGSVAPLTKLSYTVGIKAPAPDPLRRDIKLMGEPGLFVLLFFHGTIVNGIFRTVDMQKYARVANLAYSSTASCVSISLIYHNSLISLFQHPSS